MINVVGDHLWNCGIDCGTDRRLTAKQNPLNFRHQIHQLSLPFVSVDAAHVVVVTAVFVPVVSVVSRPLLPQTLSECLYPLP